MPDYQYGSLRLTARAQLIGGTTERARVTRQVLDGDGNPESQRDDIVLTGEGTRRPTIIIAAGVTEHTRLGRRFIAVPASGAEIMGPNGHLDLAPGVYEVTSI